MMLPSNEFLHSSRRSFTNLRSYEASSTCRSPCNSMRRVATPSTYECSTLGVSRYTLKQLSIERENTENTTANMYRTSDDGGNCVDGYHQQTKDPLFERGRNSGGTIYRGLKAVDVGSNIRNGPRNCGGGEMKETRGRPSKAKTARTSKDKTLHTSHSGIVRKGNQIYDLNLEAQRIKATPFSAYELEDGFSSQWCVGYNRSIGDIGRKLLLREIREYNSRDPSWTQNCLSREGLAYSEVRFMKVSQLYHYMYALGAFEYALKVSLEFGSNQRKSLEYAANIYKSTENNTSLCSSLDSPASAERGCSSAGATSEDDRGLDENGKRQETHGWEEYSETGPGCQERTSVCTRQGGKGKLQRVNVKSTYHRSSSTRTPRNSSMLQLAVAMTPAEPKKLPRSRKYGVHQLQGNDSRPVKRQRRILLGEREEFEDVSEVVGKENLNLLAYHNTQQEIPRDGGYHATPLARRTHTSGNLSGTNDNPYRELNRIYEGIEKKTPLLRAARPHGFNEQQMLKERGEGTPTKEEAPNTPLLLPLELKKDKSANDEELTLSPENRLRRLSSSSQSSINASLYFPHSPLKSNALLYDCVASLEGPERQHHEGRMTQNTLPNVISWSSPDQELESDSSALGLRPMDCCLDELSPLRRSCRRKVLIDNSTVFQSSQEEDVELFEKPKNGMTGVSIFSSWYLAPSTNSSEYIPFTTSPSHADEAISSSVGGSFIELESASDVEDEEDRVHSIALRLLQEHSMNGQRVCSGGDGPSFGLTLPIGSRAFDAPPLEI